MVIVWSEREKWETLSSWLEWSRWRIKTLGVLKSSNTLHQTTSVAPLGLSRKSKMLTDYLRGTRIGQRAVGYGYVEFLFCIWIDRKRSFPNLWKYPKAQSIRFAGILVVTCMYCTYMYIQAHSGRRKHAAEHAAKQAPSCRDRGTSCLFVSYLLDKEL